MQKGQNMFGNLFGKKGNNKKSEDEIRAEKLVQHLQEKYGMTFQMEEPALYDYEGTKRIGCTCISQDYSGIRFEADAQCSDDGVCDVSDGFMDMKYKDELEACARKIMDKVFPHYTLVMDNDNTDREYPDRDVFVSFDTFIRPYEDCSDISFSVITDMDRAAVEAVLPKLPGLLKENNVRMEILVNIVPAEKYQEEADKLITDGSGSICRSSLGYAFIDYDDEAEDIEILEREDS